MIRSLIKLALILVAAILVYNYFFGTNAEQQQSREIFGKMKDLVVAGANMLKTEKEKFDAGKYDRLMDQLGGAYKAVRDRAQYVDEKILTRLDELEQRKARLEKELQQIEATENTPAPAPAPKKGIKSDPKQLEQTAAKAADLQRRKEKLQREMEKLYQDSEALLKQASEK